jgi:hypothetical protein
MELRSDLIPACNIKVLHSQTFSNAPESSHKFKSVSGAFPRLSGWRSASMTPEEAKEFSEARGQIQGGSWRHAALAANLGIPEALGLSLDEWIKKYCGGHIKMVAEKRREAALELSKDGFSNRKIAKVLGVDKNTIGHLEKYPLMV